MRSLGICTARRHPDKLNYEKRRLYEEGRAQYDIVRLIDPREVTFSFERGAQKPGLVHLREDISTLTTLIVRSTGGREAATTLLVRSLVMCGCDVFDPVERFAIGKASKLLTTLTRFQSGAGTSTYASFSREGAAALLHRLVEEGKLPLVVKPSSGKKGRGVHVIGDFAEGMQRLGEHFAWQEYSDDPFFLQDLLQLEREYRVLVVDGEPLGIVEKVRPTGGIAANAAQGARFVAVEAPDVVRAALPHVSSEGILGVDVAVDTEGDIHVIEANRAPDWEAFEQATGLNVARLLIDRAIQRLSPANGRTEDSR
jgi:glutathione synthase/RimK-type ligase-like ATP-grasp enzyme